jgi:hypothetical protein
MRCSGVCYIMSITHVTTLSTGKLPKLFDRSNSTVGLTGYAASKHSLRIIWVFLMFGIKQLSMQMRYNMFSYFKWVRARSGVGARTILLHFFFEFCKVFALASFNGNNNSALHTDEAFTGLTNYSFSSYRACGSPLTISKGPMARKKRSREQYTSYRSVALVSFKLKIN